MTENKRLKILIITETLPYPLNSGGKICLYNFVDYLRKFHDFTIFVPSYTNDDETQKMKLNALWPNVCIEYVSLTKPTENKSISGFLNKSLAFLSRKIAALVNTPAAENELSYKLDFTDSFKPYPSTYIKALKTISNKKAYEIIQIQFTRNLNLLSVLPEKPKKIFEQIESQFDVMRDFTVTKKIDATYSDYLVKNCEFLENAFINSFDAIFTLNNHDSNYFKKVLKGPAVYSSPFGVLDVDIPAALKSEFEVKKLVFSGNESHYPNLDALEWYLKEIHPSVSQKPGPTLHITGKWTEAGKSRLTAISNNIKFEGFVEDYKAFLQNSIVIVPIRIGGGGLRTKILYAMANGIPVVSTHIGAYGIEGNHAEHFYLADSASKFIKAIMQISDNKQIAEQLRQNAFKLVSEKYSQTKTSELRNKLYKEITGK